ncbi:MAG: hypothetical protein A3E36_04165 [Candidatus Andersenbacteria bacterium RIFCSPHIGHO2_12_FULL_45_11b]|uniref:Uncharacterized protein n=1 Tax=Candidatus Andersenbacteria bacterium RIFCSPHIGHO2_12_FULL_45_11b TaxID=1797282 RepID=A0A1G1X9Q3_9BACT|nr:MAG: hypothetical protein A3E36_04165 [Candidatus Andersenbacteria bacterium RIFCSPHIGHO2_12_FULL_45_11b]
MATEEHQRRAALNAKQNHLDVVKQRRASPREQNSANYDPEYEDEAQREYAHKQNLALLKNTASAGVKKLDQRAGAAAGGFVGGWVGSIIPFAGTAIGAFIGRYFGKKWGATKIIIMSIVATLCFIALLILLLIILFKGYCDSWTVTRWLDWATIDTCKGLGSLQNTQ